MATNGQIISRALRLLGVLGEGESASPEQAADCLPFLNAMLESWTEVNIDLGWFEQSDTTADAPIPKWSEKGVVSKFAQELRPIYPSSSLDPSVYDDNQNGYAIILRKAVVDPLEGADMSHLGAGLARWNIENDSF